MDALVGAGGLGVVGLGGVVLPWGEEGGEEVFEGVEVLVVDGGGDDGFDEVVAGDVERVGAEHLGGALRGGGGFLGEAVTVAEGPGVEGGGVGEEVAGVVGVGFCGRRKSRSSGCAEG